MITCRKCLYSHTEVRVTLTTLSGDETKINIVTEYPEICRAPRWAGIIKPDGFNVFRPPHRGQEIEPDDTCDAATTKKRR